MSCSSKASAKRHMERRKTVSVRKERKFTDMQKRTAWNEVYSLMVRVKQALGRYREGIFGMLLRFSSCG